MTSRPDNSLRWTIVAAVLLALCACGDGKGSNTAVEPTGQAGAGATAGNGAGPDTSGLGAIILGKINGDPSRKDMKVTGKLLEFSIVSVDNETLGDVANAVVQCKGTAVFDGDTDWGMSGMKKAGEPAPFECQAEYVNEGSGWQVFGPMGIYPLG